MITIGCHLSSSGGYAQMARDAIAIGANTFQFFTRNPRGGAAKPIDPADIAAFHELAAEGGIERILCHASYTLNPASDDPAVRDFALAALRDDLQRMEYTPGQLYNMHPGMHKKQGVERGIELTAACINAALEPQQSTTLLLETLAGKGSEIGTNFLELAAIISRIELQDRVGVCLDSCHVWDAGYDIANELDRMLEDFDRCIGLSRLRAIHLNDSMNPCGSHKDRHARLGEGCIGLDALIRITQHPALRDLPFYLETPNKTLDGFAQEIALIRKEHP
ncbi:MAG: deoxyribonuclease IV [Coriobacteriales bacterium]|nr:deoxyribonuclease IV [Coriobacteriales bacterium]